MDIVVKNTSPLRYPGGKTRARKILDNILTKYFDISLFDTIISPFFGGGSFEFYLQNKYHKRIIANDKFTPLYNFWKQVQNNKDLLCSLLRTKREVDKEKFYYYRKKIIENADSDLLNAIYFFIINRCSFSGATLSGGFSYQSSNKRFTESSIDRINQLNLDYIDFYNLDFEDFLSSIHTTNALIFLDPPYYLNKSNLYGTNGNMHESFNHQKLYETISKKKSWMITYNDCPYIRDLYKDYLIITADWKYGMNNTKLSSEIVIICK